MLAEMLQLQFDQEYDRALRKEEAKYNGKSKVSVSLSNYRMIPKGSMPGEDSDEYIDDDDPDGKKMWDSFEAAQKSSLTVSKSGISKTADNKFVTKHDTVITSRRNACRVMEKCDDIKIGDGGGFDMQLSNRVYNHLKVFSVAEQKRAARLHDKHEKATATMALDPKSRLMLHKLVDHQVLDAVHGVISTGKEAVILHAEGGHIQGKNGEDDVLVPKECAIKVFKTTLNEFKNRDQYIRDDYRFRTRFNKQNPRKIIHMWAEKEMHNLTRMHQAGLHCPQVVLLRKHILVMSFIGSDGVPAAKIREAILSSRQVNTACEQVLSMMQTMYRECNLIHADLSEYNILWHDDHCWFIDVSQAIEPTHPNAFKFLFRDCSNVVHFFQRLGASDVPSAHDLFQSISGFPYDGSKDSEMVHQISDFERNEELLTFDDPRQKVYPFDFCWKASQSQREKTQMGQPEVPLSE